MYIVILFVNVNFYYAVYKNIIEINYFFDLKCSSRIFGNNKLGLVQIFIGFNDFYQKSYVGGESSGRFFVLNFDCDVVYFYMFQQGLFIANDFFIVFNVIVVLCGDIELVVIGVGVN